MKKLFYFAFLSILFPFWAHASSDFSGYAWVGNNYGENGETSSPSVLVAKMQETYLDGSTVKGVAEMGVAGKNFLLKSQINPISSLNGVRVGYLKFDQGIPAEDCFGLPDCHPVTWEKKESSINEEGYFTGWAKLEIGSPGKYPDVWLRFKAPNKKDYNCDENIKSGEDYFVCSKPDGSLRGFAWSSGLASSSISDNPGLGFFDFSNVKMPLIEEKSDSTVEKSISGENNVSGVSVSSSDQTKLEKKCSVDFVNSAITEKKICGLEEKTMYKASTNFIDIKEYTWQCQGESPQVNTSLTHECSGDKPPSLIIFTKDDEEDVVCSSDNKIIVDSMPNCSIKAGENLVENSADGTFHAAVNAEIKATVSGRCLEGTSISWESEALVQNSSDSKVFQAKATSAGSASIQAYVTTKEGKRIDCGKINIEVKEKIHFGI